MTIATLHRVFSPTVLLLGFTALVACGGGGGGGDNTTASRSSNSTTGTSSAGISSAGISSSVGVSSLTPSSSSASSAPLPDTIPNSFSFNSVTGVELSAVTPSDAVTISGINTPATVSVTGGEYSIDGAAFTTIDGQVSNGQALAVRLTASAVHSTTSSATVTVGGVSASFSVTTRADTTPEAFSFEPVTDAALDTVYTSGTITVTGIDAAVPITVTGGEYAINSEETFTSAAGTVSANNTVRLRGTSATGNDLTHAVVVTIGGVSATYSITTIPDTTPPVAEFKFPTPYTMSEANTVKVRGIATDDNTITSVKVVVRSFKLDTPDETIASTEFEVTPKVETNGVKDFSSWTADIPLTALAENEIKVIATDENDNTIANEDANKVTIRQADVLSAFPDEVNQFKYIFAGLAIDRDRLLISEQSDENIIAVDIRTGQRTIFSENPTENNEVFALAIDPISRRLFASSSGPLYEINIVDGSIVNKFETAPLDNYFNISIETVNGQANLVFVENVYLGPGKLAKFSLSNNELEIVSDENKIPGLEDVFGLDVDFQNNRYLIASGGQTNDLNKHAIIAVDRVTGQHSVFSSNAVGTGPLFSGMLTEGYSAALIDIEVDQKRNRALISEFPAKVFAVDLTTGNRSWFKDISYKNVDSDSAKSFDLYNMKIDVENDLMFGLDSKRESVFVIDLETEERVIISKSQK